MAFVGVAPITLGRVAALAATIGVCVRTAPLAVAVCGTVLRVVVMCARVAVFAGVFASVAGAVGPMPDLGVLGAGARTEGFAQVLEPRPLEFPRDHGPHPDYRQEWWYVTGNLDATNGERFGFELTFFRFALAPASEQLASSVQPTSSSVESRWRTRQIYMAHFAITDVSRKRFRFAQKLSRGAVGLAGAQTTPLRVWIDDWSLRSVSPDEAHWSLHAMESGYELTLDAQGLLQPILNGDRGFSRKSSDPGSASSFSCTVMT